MIGYSGVELVLELELYSQQLQIFEKNS